MTNRRRLTHDDTASRIAESAHLAELYRLAQDFALKADAESAGLAFVEPETVQAAYENGWTRERLLARLCAITAVT